LCISFVDCISALLEFPTSVNKQREYRVIILHVRHRYIRSSR